MRILETTGDVTPEILDAATECVEWFTDSPMPTEDFIDRLCKTYADGWDIESYYNSAVLKIMRHARAIKREIAA